MKCKKCGTKLRVSDSRPLSDEVRWRAYKCSECGARFYSEERLLDD